MALKSSGSPIVTNQQVPISNSAASSYLRAAAFEAAVAKKVVESIFQNLYLRSQNERSVLIDILDGFLETSPQKESILRSLLATAHTTDRPHATQSLLKSVVGDIVAIFAPLLLEQSAIDSLHQDLVGFVTAAERLWNRGQRSWPRIVAVANIAQGVGNWGDYSRQEGATSPTQSQEDVINDSPRPVTVLFPQIYVHDPDEHEILFSGYALWSHADLFIKGRSEFRKQNRRVRSYAEGSIISANGKKRGSVSKTSPHQRSENFTSSQRSANMASRPQLRPS